MKQSSIRRVWQSLSQVGKRMGVFGSLQLYPTPKADAYEFYVSDTFSPGYETFPVNYFAFQRFNFRQTQQNGASEQPGSI